MLLSPSDSNYHKLTDQCQEQSRQNNNCLSNTVETTGLGDGYAITPKLHKSVERERHDAITLCNSSATGFPHPVTAVPGFCAGETPAFPVLPEWHSGPCSGCGDWQGWGIFEIFWGFWRISHNDVSHFLIST